MLRIEFTTFDRSNRFFFSSYFSAISSRLLLNKTCFLKYVEFLIFKSVLSRERWFDRLNRFFFLSQSSAISSRLTRRVFSNMLNKFLTFKSVLSHERCFEPNLPRSIVRTDSSFLPSLRLYPLDYHLIRHVFSNIEQIFNF